MAFDPVAVYNQTVADLGLQETFEEGSLNEAETNLKANAGYQESEITRSEPGVYRAGANAANRGGLLTSGINAHRKEGVAANFAARRAQNQLSLTEGEARIKREREGGKLKREQSLHGAQGTEAQEQDRIARENTIVTPAAAAAPAASSPVQPQVPTIASSKPQPITGSGPKRVGGKYVTQIINGKPTRVYQAF